MNQRHPRATKLFVRSTAIMALLAGGLYGQGNSDNAPGHNKGDGKDAKTKLSLPQDWSHQSVVFSAPTTPEGKDAADKDPRYKQQSSRRNLAGSNNPNVINPAAPSGSTTNGNGKKNPPPAGTTPQGDWNLSLGASANSGVAPHMSPAKFNFDVNQGPSCSTDFVVFGENVAGAAAIAASQTGTFSGSNVGGASAVTVNGTAFTASAGTAATKGGTFSAQPPAGAVTITNGASVLTVTNGGTPKAVVGTFSSAPSVTGDSLSVVTGGNTLTLTPGGTAAKVVGTFSGQTTTGTITIGYTGNGSNSLVLTPTTSSSSQGTVTLSGTPSGGNTVQIGSNVYTFSTTSCGTTANCVFISGTSSSAANLRAAIDANSTQCGSASPCFGSATTANPSATATVSSGVVTVTNVTQTNITLAKVGSNIAVSGATIGFGPGCTSSTAGAFLTSATTSTEAANLRDAINSCDTAFPAVGVTATSSGSATTVSAAAPGSFITLSPAFSANVFSWGSVTAGTDGTNTCPTVSTAGTFTNSTSSNTLASNLATAISSCHTSFTAVNATATSSTNTTTVTQVTPGTTPTLTTADASGVFTWGSPSAGANGANACPTLATATFATSSTTTTLSFNLAAAINLCQTAFGFGVSATPLSTGITSTTTVTAAINGTAGNSIALGNTLATGFAWAAATLTGGTDGTNTTTNFATSADTTTEAANLAAAINRTTATSNLFTATSIGAVVTVTDKTAGAAGNLITVSDALSTFAWTAGTLAGGADAQPSIVAVNNLYSGAAVAASDTGTVSTNNTLTGTETLTVTNGTTLTLHASPPVKASQTGTFSAVAGAGSVTVGGATLTNGGTASTIAGTVSAAPTGSIVLHVGSNTVTLTLNNAASNQTTGVCTGLAPTYTGTYNNTGNTNQNAGSIASAFSLCSGLDATAVAGSSAVTVTASTLGAVTLSGTPTTGNFSWGSATTGSAGSNACTTNSGTFAANSSAATEASNLAAAITACSAATVTASASGTTVTVTAKTAGTGGNSITSTDSMAGFGWTAGTLAGGSDGDATGTNFPYWTTNNYATTTVLATNLAAAINRGTNGSSVGVSATSSTNVVTVTATTAGSAGNSIALGTLSGLSWAKATLFGGTAAGLCGTGTATVTWSYDTHTGATGGAVTTSPVLSLDGQEIAFVESIGTGSVLHILRPKTAAINGTSTEGNVTAPVVPTTVISSTSGTAASDWTTCLAGSGSCMFNLVYNTAANTNSSPYYIYPTPVSDSDVVYVGDDNGKLWKITGVFNGTPALATGAWASGITVNSTHKLTSPVVDFTTNTVFVGDDSGKISNVTVAGALGSGLSGQLSSMTDGPVLDGSTGKLLFFGLSSTTPMVVQTSTALTNTVSATLGGTGAAQIHRGTFDNTYYASPDGTGKLYVCGHVSTTANTPTLYSIAMTTGAMATSTTSSLALGTGTGECSPLSEIYNSGQSTDWMFVGVPQSCAFGGSATGCVESFDITSAFPTTALATFASPSGTSGIIVDNVSVSGHASSLYYSPLTASICTGNASATGCAVQVTQSGLK
jgi:hypothetical protein